MFHFFGTCALDGIEVWLAGAVWLLGGMIVFVGTVAIGSLLLKGMLWLLVTIEPTQKPKPKAEITTPNAIE